jgi:hypothetical protein
MPEQTLDHGRLLDERNEPESPAAARTRQDVESVRLRADASDGPAVALAKAGRSAASGRPRTDCVRPRRLRARRTPPRVPCPPLARIRPHHRARPLLPARSRAPQARRSTESG